MMTAILHASRARHHDPAAFYRVTLGDLGYDLMSNLDFLTDERSTLLRQYTMKMIELMTYVYATQSTHYAGVSVDT